jgi:hypothetical protein
LRIKRIFRSFLFSTGMVHQRSYVSFLRQRLCDSVMCFPSMLCQIADDITPKCDNHTIVICMELHIRSLVFSCYPYYYVVVRGQVKMLNEPTCPFYLLLSFIAPYKAGGTVTRYSTCPILSDSVINMIMLYCQVPIRQMID